MSFLGFIDAVVTGGDGDRSLSSSSEESESDFSFSRLLCFFLDFFLRSLLLSLSLSSLPLDFEELLDLLSLSLEEEITGLLVVLGLAALDEDGVPLRGLFGAGGGGGAAAADLDDEDDDLDEVFILLELDLLVFDSLLLDWSALELF